MIGFGLADGLLLLQIANVVLNLSTVLVSFSTIFSTLCIILPPMVTVVCCVAKYKVVPLAVLYPHVLDV